MKTIRKGWRWLCHGANMLVGVPSYESYVQHMAAQHPEQTPMSYADFFRNRQNARYGVGGKGGFRCC